MLHVQNNRIIRTKETRMKYWLVILIGVIFVGLLTGDISIHIKGSAVANAGALPSNVKYFGYSYADCFILNDVQIACAEH